MRPGQQIKVPKVYGHKFQEANPRLRDKMEVTQADVPTTSEFYVFDDRSQQHNAGDERRQ